MHVPESSRVQELQQQISVSEEKRREVRNGVFLSSILESGRVLEGQQMIFSGEKHREMRNSFVCSFVPSTAFGPSLLLQRLQLCTVFTFGPLALYRLQLCTAFNFALEFGVGLETSRILRLLSLGICARVWSCAGCAAEELLIRVLLGGKLLSLQLYTRFGKLLS